jgi:hypothetical protein
MHLFKSPNTKNRQFVSSVNSKIKINGNHSPSLENIFYETAVFMLKLIKFLVIKLCINQFAFK